MYRDQMYENMNIDVGVIFVHKFGTWFSVASISVELFSAEHLSDAYLNVASLRVAYLAHAVLHFMAHWLSVESI